MVASELRRCEAIEARAAVLAKRVNDLDVAADGRCGVVATYEARRAGIAVAGSQTPPVTTPIPLRITQPPVGRRASGFVQVAKGRVARRRRLSSPLRRYRGCTNLVSQTFASWNQLRTVLLRIHALRQIA
jgi:hypothetical protein